MNRQDNLRNLLIAAGVFLLVYLIGEKYLIPPPPNPSVAPTEAPRTSDAGNAVGQEASPPLPGAIPSSTVPPSSEKVSVNQLRVGEAEQEQTLFLGAEENDGADPKASEAPFRMRLKVSNVGASVETAGMTDHAEQLGQPPRYQLLAPVGDAQRGWFRSLAIEKINIDDVDVSLADKRWHVVDSPSEYRVEGSAFGQKAEFAIDIFHQETPLLRLTRTLRLPRQTKESGRHDLESELTIRNLTPDAHRVVIAFRGGLGVRKLSPQQDDRVVDTGVRDADGRILGNRTTAASVLKSLKVPLFLPSAADPASRLSWAATGNTYFTCTLAPLSHSGTEAAEYLSEVAALDLDGNPATTDDTALRFVTRAENVAPTQALTYKTDIYLGEKDGVAFRQFEAYRARNYYYQIAQSFGWCTFNFLVELMIRLLNGIHGIIPNYGVAIIFLVLIVRTLLHPITKKGQVNMVRMQKQMGELAPKMEEIKRKHANDKVRLQQETMKLYREGGVNPAGQFLTCLPMLCQMPIWVALWLSLNNNIHMRHEPFIAWIRDLTAPDALYTFASPINLPLFGPIASFNLLPFLLGITMYAQQKLQPKPQPSPNMTQQQRDQQEMMQKMMPIMSIMMFMLFYKAPSGLTLYITASSIFGTVEQWLIRKHVKAHEAAGTLLKPVVVREKRPDANDAPKTMVASWFERLQKKAEEAQRVQKTQRAKPRR